MHGGASRGSTFVSCIAHTGFKKTRKVIASRKRFIFLRLFISMIFSFAKEKEFFIDGYTKSPAMAAFNKLTSAPPKRALSPSFVSIWRFSGQIAPMPPICMPMLEKFAKPARA